MDILEALDEIKNMTRMNSKVSDVQLMSALNKRREKDFWNEEDEKAMHDKFESYVRKSVFIASTTGPREMSDTTETTGFGLFFEEINEDSLDQKVSVNQDASSKTEVLDNQKIQEKLYETGEKVQYYDSDEEPIVIPEEENDDAQAKKLDSYNLGNKVNLNTMIKFKKKQEIEKKEEKSQATSKPNNSPKTKSKAQVDYSDISEDEQSID